MEHLIDTNILIRYLNGDVSEELSNILDIQTIKISIITKIEILSWNGYSETQMNYLMDFLKTCIIIPLDDNVVNETIFIRRKYKLKIPDAIIASTALKSNLTLISNDSDLHNIKGLKCIKMF